MDPTKGLFRRRPSSTSTHSRLRAQSSNVGPSPSPSMLSVSSAAVGGSHAAHSCPTSPKHSPQPRRSVATTERIPEDEVAYQEPTATTAPTTSSEAAEYAAAFEDARREQRQQELQRSSSRQSIKAVGRGHSISGSGRLSSSSNRREPTARESPSSTYSRREPPLPETNRREPPLPEANRREPTLPEANSSACSRREPEDHAGALLQRSASTVSGFGVRPRSSPAGLHAYTGSVPSSVHGSRVDLREIDKGSAIYLGCTAPRASTLSINSSRGSSGGSAPPSPCHTPPSSPRHGYKRSTSLAKKPR